MADIFSNAISFLLEKGFFNLLLWLFFSAVFYAILRRIKIFGESAVINGIIALTASFFIFAFPYITGLSYIYNFSLYFAQVSLFALVLVFALLLASFFYPNLWEFIQKTFQHRTQIWVMFALAFILLITSNLISILTLPLGGQPSSGSDKGLPGFPVPQTVIVFLASIFIFLVLILIAAVSVRG